MANFHFFFVVETAFASWKRQPQQHRKPTTHLKFLNHPNNTLQERLTAAPGRMGVAPGSGVMT